MRDFAKTFFYVLISVTLIGAVDDIAKTISDGGTISGDLDMAGNDICMTASGDDCISGGTDNNFRIEINGTYEVGVNSNGLTVATGAAVFNELSSLVNPVFSPSGQLQDGFSGISGESTMVANQINQFSVGDNGVETMRLEELDLAVGACTAHDFKEDSGGATIEWCRCNAAGTAWNCVSVTTANGPAD